MTGVVRGVQLLSEEVRSGREVYEGGTGSVTVVELAVGKMDGFKVEM